MKIKWKPLQLLVYFGVLLLFFSTIAPSAAAFTVQQNSVNQDGVSVNVKQIDNLKNLFSNVALTKSSDNLSQTLVSVLSHDKVGEYGNFTVSATSHDVLKYTYPNATDEQLANLTINAEQAVNWLHHVGYSATLINRSLTTDEIKKELDASSPIIPILSNQNKSDWMNASISSVLYAHDDVQAGTEKLQKSFIETIGLGEAMVQDGQESKAIIFPDQANSTDPTETSDSYLWTQTITNIKQDPAAHNSQTLNTKAKDGIFASKVTTSGTDSQVEFTDPLLKGMQYQASDNPELTVSANAQNKGWLPESKYGAPIDIDGQGLRIEALKASFCHLPQGQTGGVAYSAYVQGIGWQAEQSNGGIAGTTGKSLRIEAIKMRLTGALAQNYYISYATYVQGKGWTAYSQDNNISGTTGQSLRIEGISIGVFKKKLPKTPSDETKRSAVALANLYEDASHQKTVSDFEQFAKVSPQDVITSQQIMDWYHFLGLQFDTQAGRLSKSKAETLNKSGRLYFTVLKAITAPDNIKNFGAIGFGYMDNSFGYTPILSFLNDDFTPSAYFSLRPKETFSQNQDRMKVYDYDHLYSTDEHGKLASEYQEEVTLYNIRTKDSNSKVVDPNLSSSSNTSPTTSTQLINANYHHLSHFIATETQGQEPWCSEYIAAASVNDLNQMTASTPLSSRVTAQGVMQALNPSLSLDKLKATAGGNIQNTLNMLKNNYQVTADVENKALSFDEVKKELDAGSLVQMDAYDQNETAPQGSAENTGHSLAIVGYVMPADGNTTNHAPYYEVWNPWWGYTFYVSSKAPYINLAGAKYKWTRTWHNWRKTKGSSQSTISPAIAQKKVASAVNPNAVKQLPPLESSNKIASLVPSFSANALFGTPKNLLNDSVSEMKATVSGRAYFFGNTYGYADSTDGSKMKVLKNRNSKTINSGLGFDFKASVNDMNSAYTWLLGSGVALAVIVAVVALCPAGGAVLNFLSTINSFAGKLIGQVISGLLGLPGNFKTGLLAFFMINLVNYLWRSHQMGVLYDEL